MKYLLIPIILLVMVEICSLPKPDSGSFRFKEYKYKADNVRILAFGGSTTAGHRSPQDGWPYWLERSLGAEVINLGWWGATSSQELLFLKHYSYLKPDFVIVYDGYNDLMQAEENAEKYIANNEKAHELMRNKWHPIFIKDWLYRNVALVRRLNIFGNRHPDAVRDLLKDKTDMRWDMIQPEVMAVVDGHRKTKNIDPLQYYQNLCAMAWFLRKNDIPFLFVFQPFLTEKLMRLNGEVKEEDITALSSGTYRTSPDIYKRVAEKSDWHKWLMETAAEGYGGKFLDATKIFDDYDNKEVYIDTCHYTEFGTMIVAEKIREHMTTAARKGLTTV